MSISFKKIKKVMKEKGIIYSDLRLDRVSTKRNSNEGISPSILAKIFTETGIVKKSVTTETINKLCKLLNCQPGDIMEYIPDDEDK